MSRRISRRWAGLLGALAVVGCGPESKPVAQVTPATETPTLTPPAVPNDPAPATTPAATPATQPGAAFPGLPFLPPPATPPTTTAPTGGTFVAPSSPTFTPPETLGGTQLPGTPPQPPVAQPPKADPPKTDPPPVTGTVGGNPSEGTTKPPPEPKYPDRMGGKDLKGWLKELEYTAAGPIQKDDQIRETAVKIIPSFGPNARKPAMKPLIEAIRVDPDPGVQVAAITVMSNMGFDLREEVKPVIQILVARMKASATGSIVKMYCVRSLASFGPDAVGCIPVFKDSCLDPSWETRREIAIALSLVGAAPVDEEGKPKKKDGVVIGPNRLAIDTLMDYQLKDRSVTVRMEAVKSLLALGPPVPKNPADFAELTKEIQKTLTDVVLFESGKGPKVNARNASPDRGMYVWALLLQTMYDDRKINDNLKELAKLVAEPDGPRADEVRLFAIQALGVAGPLLKHPLVEKQSVEKAVKAVTDALRYEHEAMLQYTALQSLAMMGKPARDIALPELEKLMAKAPKPAPADAPKGTPPDDSMQKMAKQTKEVLLGERKMEDFGKEDPKPGDKKEPEKKEPEKK